jgi:surfeit locus 1 family protein
VTAGGVGLTAFGRRFEPRLWPTLLTLAALAVLAGLGAWQLERRAWKAELIDRIAQRLDTPAVALPAAIDDPAAWDYRPVQADGTFRHAQTLHLLGRVHQGRPGAHLITPLIRDGRAAPVLVNRGWVPLEMLGDRAGEADADIDRPAGPVTVTGLLRQPPEPGWFAPGNDPAGNEWLRVDIPAMAEAAGLTTDPLPLLLTARPAAPGADLPVPVEVRVDIPNDHLQYALTWFALAAALLAVYLVSQTRRPA